jgi:nucleotide-binding universal stress UspA family protein
MPKVLLAVDGSKSALRATRKLIESARWYKEPLEVELVTVCPPVPHVILAKEMVDRYYRQEGTKSLVTSTKLLDKAKVPYHAHVLVGEIAHTIVKHAQSSSCKTIYMGTRGMSAISNLVLGSIAIKVVHLADVPVMLVK